MKVTPAFIQPNRPPSPDGLRYDAEPAVFYEPKKDGPVAAFEQSEKGQAVRRQFQSGVSSLTAFGARHHIEQRGGHAQGFALFGNRIREGSRGYYSTEIATLYGQGKQHFDLICAKVADERIPLATRVTHVAELSRSVGVCGPGSVTNVIKTAEDLCGTVGLTGHVKRVWEAMVEQSIMAFAKTRHQTTTNFAGNEIHYVNGYRNYLASQYGLTERPDVFVSSAELEPHLGACSSHVAQQVRPETLLRQLAETCLQELQARFAPLKGRVLSETEVASFYKEYEEGFQGELANRYGKIEAQVVVCDQAESPLAEPDFRLTGDLTMLMRAIGKNLRAAGVLEDEKFPVIAEQQAGKRKLKQIGAGLYVKQRTEDGAILRRGFRLNDLETA